MANRVTYRQLDELLRRLGFAATTAPGRWRAYQHSGSETMIVLADRGRAALARELDLVSVRRHLVDNHLINEDEFDGFLGRSPR